VFQRLLQLGEPDSPAPQFLAVSVLAQIGLAPEDVRRFLDRLVERQILERMERVVMDEDCDRPLGRQQVAGVLDHFAQSVQVGIMSRRFEQRVVADGRSMHVCH